MKNTMNTAPVVYRKQREIIEEVEITSEMFPLLVPAGRELNLMDVILRIDSQRRKKISDRFSAMRLEGEMYSTVCALPKEGIFLIREYRIGKYSRPYLVREQRFSISA